MSKKSKVVTRQLEPFPFRLGFCVRECKDGEIASTWADGPRGVVSFSSAYDEKSWREAVPHEAVHVVQAVEDFVEDRFGGEVEAYLVEHVCRLANQFLDGYF